MAFNLADVLKNVPESGTGEEQLERIPLDLIDGDPNNFYQLSDIPALADNISLCGLQQPIRVRQKEDGRYIIVSGHRRRAALEMLVADGYERFREVSCIVEQDPVSPALQQLRLIYANCNTRSMTAWEISQQAEQVKDLLYRLKEEEGYEFPGRMRDHVAQAVGVSKSKLARLKVIQDNLAMCWADAFEQNKINESTAYAIAQLAPVNQQLLFDVKKRTNANLQYLYADDVKRFADRAAEIENLACGESGGRCLNITAKKDKAARTERYACNYSCGKCCSECAYLASCKNACAKLKDKVNAMKTEARTQKQQEQAEQAARELPKIQQIQDLWARFGELRKASGKSVEDTFKATKMWYGVSDDKRYRDLENGVAKISTGTSLPYGYTCSLSDIQHLISLADLFGCSLDYLLCREQQEVVSNSGTGWQSGNPWNLGEYAVLVRWDERCKVSLDRMYWNGDDWMQFGENVEMLDGTEIIAWIELPEEI